ncbi:MAG: hypothetical protein BA863_12005 [Desulfovibrio sp. S3730MH75]|nr:MAG: hypothetical protein BA863_12005 [Desulfovibrio sp. S3730MH75]
MKEYKVIKNQIIAGTDKDSHGESYPKDFFEDLLEATPEIMPLHTQHDMGAKTSGFLTNFKLVPHKDHWVVRADVHIDKESENPDLNGFSFSATMEMAGKLENPIFNIYLPYPNYNDRELVNELLLDEPDLMVGKWVKKSLDPLSIGLIASAALLIVSPEWEIQYKQHVRPFLKKLLLYIPKLKKKNIPVDLVQQVEYYGHTVAIYFVPDRTNEILNEESTQIEHIETGYKNAIDFMTNDSKSSLVGVKMIKLLYDPEIHEYTVFHIQYSNGEDNHIL